MPCYQQQSLPAGVTSQGRVAYPTQADCLQACKEGACCEGTTCSVKPQCQCQGAGKVFKGVGTTCTPNPCFPMIASCCYPNSQTAYAVGGSSVIGKRCVGGVYSNQAELDAAQQTCSQGGGVFTLNSSCTKCSEEKGCFPAYEGYCNPLP